MSGAVGVSRAGGAAAGLEVVVEVGDGVGHSAEGSMSISS
jgi:hypothetical protein